MDFKTTVDHERIREHMPTTRQPLGMRSEWSSYSMPCSLWLNALPDEVVITFEYIDRESSCKALEEAYVEVLWGMNSQRVLKIASKKGRLNIDWINVVQTYFFSALLRLGPRSNSAVIQAVLEGLIEQHENASIEINLRDIHGD